MRRLNIGGASPTKGKTGFLSLALLLLFLVIGLPKITKGEAPQSIIRADASTSSGIFNNNIAGGINFWGKEEAQRRFIEEIGAGLYRIKVRLHKVKKQGDAYTNFPWEVDGLNSEDVTVLKQNLNLAKSKGCKVMIQIYGIPEWLSTSKDTRVFSNNLPNYAKYPPRDFEEWGKVVSAAITSLKALGLGEIDYYELFGEPNVGSTWYQQIMNGEPNELNHSTVEVMQNFYKVYEYTTLGIHNMDPNAKIGGPAIVPNVSGIWWTRFLCQELKSKDLPLDFYSWHWYRIDESLADILKGIKPYLPLTLEKVNKFFGPVFEKYGFAPEQTQVMVDDIYSYLESLGEQDEDAIRYPYSFSSTQLRRILFEEGFDEAELFLTEWNVNYVSDKRHDTHYGASFITRGLIDLIDSYTDAQAFYSLSYLNPVLKYRGSYELFIGNIPKVSFNAFKLFSMLGNYNERINVLSSDKDIYSIATRDQDSISLLATYYVMDESPEYSPSISSISSVKKVTVEINNIPFERYHYEIYLIDKNHSNHFFGSGPELELIGQGTSSYITGSYESSNYFQVSGNLGIYGVVLIKINKIQ